MDLKRSTLFEAGLALAIFKAYKGIQSGHELKQVYSAALAALTAESFGGQLYTYSSEESPEFTLLVSKWKQSENSEAVLLSRSIPNWDAAMVFWTSLNHNMFIKNEDFWTENKDIDRFILASTYGQWQKTPPGSPVRWAEAAKIYYESGLASREGIWHDDQELGKWEEEMVRLQPKLLKTLGYDSLEPIMNTPPDIDEPFPTGHLQEVLIAKSDYEKNNLAQIARNCIAKPLPASIPIEVLKNRDELSIAQALSWYLVEDKNGPKLTHATAATMLGMNARQAIGVHLKRARTTLSESGTKPELSGYIRSEYIEGDPPGAIEITSEEL